MKKTLILLSILTSFGAYTQSIEISPNGGTTNSSAILDLKSTTKGFLLPRMSNAQMRAIPSPAQGLLAFCTDCSTNGDYYFYKGTEWVALGSTTVSVSATVGPVGANANENGATITNGVLNLAPADANNPGIVTKTDQTFGGIKTFSNGIVGNVTGNATTVTTNANLTGIVTSTGNATSIANGAITNAMLANGAVANLSGTNTGDQTLPTLSSLGAVASNSAITGATNTKITYDAKGLVTAGAAATTADIAESTDKKYVTDAQLTKINNTLGSNTGDNAVNSLYSGLVSNATHTGDVTGSTTLTIANDVVTTAKIAAGAITDSKVTDVAASKITGTLPVSKGGTGSDTQNFVDLTNAQTIAGAKTFGNDIMIKGTRVGTGDVNNNTNIVIGTNLVSGVRNTALGRAAMNMYADTTFTGSNTSVGFRNMNGLETGSGNTSLGSETMFTIANGSGNTSIGANTLYNSYNTNNNTAIGESAGLNLGTGSNNTFIGKSTDVATEALTNATAIGNGAIVDANNKIQLGNGEVIAVQLGTGTNVTLETGLIKITGGTLAAGKVLTSDADGLGSWESPSGVDLTTDQTIAGAKTFSVAPVLTSSTASKALFTDTNKNIVSNEITGTGNVVMSTSPTFTETIRAENQTLSGTLGVGTNTPDASAKVEVTSTSKGFLTPRMSASQRTAISSPATGLIVYQTDASAGFYYNVGTPQAPNWVILLNEASLVDASSKITGTLPVANGGTGLTAMTPFAPVFGGTTNTGSLQSASSVGTGGQVLTSNGSDQLPSFQSIPAPVQQILTGSIVSFAGINLPSSSGYLICDGSAVNRETYANLFSVIGTTYGSGDGTTTFLLPDLRGRTIIGTGQGIGLTNRPLSSTGGEEVHTLITEEIPAHSHSLNDPGHSHIYDFTLTNTTSISDGIWLAANGIFPTNTSNATTGISINSSGGGQAHNTMSPYISLNYIIKY
jgi:microcystin-dependent protein